MRQIQKLIRTLILFKLKTFKYSLAFLAIVSTIVLYKTLKEFNENSDEFLSIHGKEVVFKLVKISSANDSIQFKVKDIQKTFCIPNDKNISLMQGEQFLGKLALQRDDFFNIELNKQTIYNLNDFQKVDAEIIKVGNKRNEIITFKYTINKNKFIRSQYVQNISEYYSGQTVIAKVNKSEPRIAYIEIYRIYPK